MTRMLFALGLALTFAAPSPAHAALSLPVWTQCLCITAAGAWTIKFRGARKTPCVILCNASPKKAPLTDVSAARRHGTRAAAHGARLGGHGRRVHLGRTHGAARALVAATRVEMDQDGRWRAIGPGAVSGPARVIHRLAHAVVRPLRHLIADAGSLPAELTAKVAQIAGACPGFHIISGFRPGATVAGTHITSLHARHRAADIAGGSYACAYRELAGWPGGVSTDAERVAHIHLSWAPGGQEWGARFRHGGGVRHYARARARHWGG